MLLNRLISKDPMTFQILSQDAVSYESLDEEGEVRNSDESELLKTSIFDSEGYGEVLVDMTQDYKDLGLISDE